MGKPELFLSYAREDVEKAIKFYSDLSPHSNVWFDKESLKPGMKWEYEVKRAIKKSDFFVALLSENYVSKIGYRHNEVKSALEILKNYPPGRVFIIPARLEECEPNYEELGRLHWIDMFPNWSYAIKQILKSISADTQLQAKIKFVESQIEAIESKIQALT